MEQKSISPYSAAAPVRALAAAQSGFTLIELMITVTIVGILAAVAYPAYTQYVMRSNRAAAASFVLGLASKQEQYNLDARQYASSVSTLGFTTLPNTLAANYTVDVAADNTVAPPTYTITATPIGNQLNKDTQCASLSINQSGLKQITGTGPIANCW